MTGCSLRGPSGGEVRFPNMKISLGKVRCAVRATDSATVSTPRPACRVPGCRRRGCTALSRRERVSHLSHTGGSVCGMCISLRDINPIYFKFNRHVIKLNQQNERLYSAF